MKAAIQFLFIFSLIGLLSSCDENTTETSNSVSNLNVSIEILDQSSGLISSTHTASNVVSFELDFGDETVINTSNNIAEHTYESSGVYTIVIKAFDADEKFLRYEEKIVIDYGDNENLHAGYSTPLSYEGMDLIFSQEFDESAIDGSIWTHELGNGCPNLCGWGNNEWQFYRTQNTTVENGIATIQAKEESFDGSNYTSSRLITKGKFAFQYGRVDIRAKLPRGKGIWPALWMLGSNIDQVGWPSCGEIDIMEMIGEQESITYGTAHWNNSGDNANFGGSFNNDEDLDREFHVYSVVWTDQSIKWYFDDQLFHTLSITASDLSEFHEPHFLIMNVAVGGNWPGYPNPSTEFPTAMDVDYIRVFQ